MSSDKIKIEAIIVNACKGDFVAESVQNGVTIKIVAKPAGKLRQHQINVLVGDKVIIQVSPYDLTRGIIVERLKNKQ